MLRFVDKNKVNNLNPPIQVELVVSESGVAFYLGDERVCSVTERGTLFIHAGLPKYLGLEMDMYGRIVVELE